MYYKDNFEDFIKNWPIYIKKNNYKILMSIPKDAYITCLQQASNRIQQLYNKLQEVTND